MLSANFNHEYESVLGERAVEVCHPLRLRRQASAAALVTPSSPHEETRAIVEQFFSQRKKILHAWYTSFRGLIGPWAMEFAFNRQLDG